MNIVWLIGNGFDVACGLESKYTDFYASDYVQGKHSNIIYNNIKDNIKSWADFEYQLGKLSFDIQSSELSKFVDDMKACYVDFSEYLNKQMNDYKATSERFSIFQDNLVNFFKFCEPDDIENLLTLLKEEKTRNKWDNIVYKSFFVIFNYTNVFNNYLKMIKGTAFNFHNLSISFTKSEPCYVHNHIPSIIMGCDNASQYNAKLLGLLSFYLDKSLANTEGKSGNISKASNIIGTGQIFVIFGMSLGETDKRWWSAIAKRVLKSEERRIVIFNYLSHEEVKILYSRIENQQRIRDTFISRLDEELTPQQKENLRSRIIVINSNKAFNLSPKDDKTLVTT